MVSAGLDTVPGNLIMGLAVLSTPQGAAIQKKALTDSMGLGTVQSKLLQGSYVPLKQEMFAVPVRPQGATAAQIKALTVHRLSGDLDCFSEDTGLETDALNGAPGVYSARYSGEPVSSERNIDKLLTELGETKNRNARFRTVVCLIKSNQEYFFEGVCEGRILLQRQGSEGFGYDAIFAPEGSQRSFAEMTQAEKNEVSHRRKAINKMILFLREQQSIH